MYNITANEKTSPVSSVFVLTDKSGNEIARNMVESGQQKEPFYIFDFDTAANQVKKFREKLPRVQIFYAMKSNDDGMMLKLAIALGLGFDCASPGEINKIRNHNVNPKSIIYAAPMKTTQQIIFARESGVRHTTFDSSCELNRLKQNWPDARLLIRLKVESDSVYKLGDKFGCDFAEALNLLEEAAKLNMTVTDLIRHDLEELFPEPEIQIIAEPGRYLCESAFTFYSNIKNIRYVDNSNKKMQMVYLNNGNLRFIEEWHTIHKFKRNKDIEMTIMDPQDTILWGPTIDDNDYTGPVQLTSCNEQDWIVIHDQGSYCKTFENRFGGMDNIQTRSVVSRKLWNMLKIKPVFTSTDFVLDTMPVCLPPTLPPLLPDNGEYVYSVNSTIID